MKYLLIAILLIIAIWNSYVILWGTEKDPDKRKKYSKIWHIIGLALRLLVFAVPFFYFRSFTEILKWSLVFISVGGVLYDFIINLIRFIYNGVPDLWYVDNKGWNAYFLRFLTPTWYWVVRGLFILMTIIFFIL